MLADKFEILAVVALLLHEYEYAAVPPDALAVALPLGEPQPVLTAVTDTLMAVGCETLALEVPEHPPASETVTV